MLRRAFARSLPLFLFVILTFNGIQSAKAELSPEAAKAALGTRAEQVLQALGKHSGPALAPFVDPAKGVRLSPYAQVDTDADVVLTRADLQNQAGLTKLRKWGSYDGSGLPIRMSFAAYSRKFIYDRDFLHAPQTAFNGTLEKGSTAINYQEAYPDAISVEYYFPPPTDSAAAPKWASLRLLFQQHEKQWFLVGIVHNQWTT